MLVRSLILAGARVNDTDANRNTALHAAAKAGHAAIVSALLQVNTIICTCTKDLISKISRK